MAATGGGSAIPAGGAGNVASLNTVSNNKCIRYYSSKYGITQEVLDTAYTQEPERIYWEGPICTTRGFSQHGGECWSDTIQQLLFFADGLKEFTQEYYYKTPYSEIEKAINELKFLNDEEKVKVKRYAQAAQLRFINHYNFSKTGNAIFDRCILNPDLEAPALRKRQSIIYGSNTAYSISEYGKGSRVIDNEYLIKSLIKIANNDTDIHLQPFILEKSMNLEKNNFALYSAKPLVIGEIYGLSISCRIFRRITFKDKFLRIFDVSESPPPGHSIGMYKCEGKTFFYDDNIGAFEVKIPFEKFQEVGIIVILLKDGVPQIKFMKHTEKSIIVKDAPGKEKHFVFFGLMRNDGKINIEVYDDSANDFVVKDESEYFTLFENSTERKYIYNIKYVDALTDIAIKLPVKSPYIPIGITNTGVPIYNFKKFVGKTTRRGRRLTRKRRSMRRR